MYFYIVMIRTLTVANKRMVLGFSICWQVQIRFPPTFRNISPVLLTTNASHIFHPNTVTSTNQVPSYFSKNLSVFFRQELLDTWITCRLQWSFPSRYWQLQIMSPPTFMLSMQLMKTHIFSQRIWIFNFVALKPDILRTVTCIPSIDSYKSAPSSFSPNFPSLFSDCWYCGQNGHR